MRNATFWSLSSPLFLPLWRVVFFNLHTHRNLVRIKKQDFPAKNFGVKKNANKISENLVLDKKL